MIKSGEKGKERKPRESEREEVQFALAQLCFPAAAAEEM